MSVFYPAHSKSVIGEKDEMGGGSGSEEEVVCVRCVNQAKASIHPSTWEALYIILGGHCQGE